MAPPKLTKELAEEALEALLRCNGVQIHAAAMLELSRGAYQNRLQAARALGLDFSAVDEMRKPKLVLKGQSILYDREGNETGRWDKTRTEGRPPEEVEHLADPKRITKISTLYDQTGKVTQQWIAEKPEEAQREALWLECAKEIASRVERAKPVPAPKALNKDLLTIYPVGDHHMGMKAWGEETGGDNYDIDISERLLKDASLHLMAKMEAETALIAFLGDFLHYDSFAAVTPQNRNLLDADGRFPKMARAAVRSIRHMVAAALNRHKTVHVIIEPGNHDPVSSIFLMELLANVYEKEPRVKVDTSPSRFHYFEFGNCLLGTHHGDTAKMDKLPGIMAHDRPEAWGRTLYRFWLTGHIHQDSKKDFPGCSVESVRVLPPADAWAANSGYRSARDMKAIVLHREHGEVGRYTVNPGMFSEKKKVAA